MPKILLTVDSPVYSGLKAELEQAPTTYSLQDYVDRVNSSPLLVDALLKYQAGPGKIQMAPNPDETTAKYMSVDRNLELTRTSIKDPKYFVAVVSHEIYGHDAARALILEVNNPKSSIYSGKSSSEIQALVLNGCYTNEFLGYV